MCVFHHASALLKGTPAQLSAKLDIPEIVLRRLLEVDYEFMRLYSSMLSLFFVFSLFVKVCLKPLQV